MNRYAVCANEVIWPACDLYTVMCDDRNTPIKVQNVKKAHRQRKLNGENSPIAPKSIKISTSRTFHMIYVSFFGCLSAICALSIIALFTDTVCWLHTIYAKMVNLFNGSKKIESMQIDHFLFLFIQKQNELKPTDDI